MTRIPVLIAGGGPTGLVLALWLTRLGVAVRIVDKNPGPADYSRALGVHARTLEFYRQLGFAEEALAGGIRAAAVNFRVHGENRARIPVSRLGEGLTPYPFILDFAQNDHERLLIRQLSALAVHVERDTELLSFEQDTDGIRATLRSADGTIETCAADYLAGCDGAHSIVRQTLGIDFQGETYSRLFYVADVEAEGLPTDDELYVDLDAADLLAVFPMVGKGHVRLVGTVRDDMGEREKDLTFADVSSRTIEEMKVTILRVNWFSPYRVHHRVARSFQKGRAFLLGDAAHIHSPVGAQGMNTGIGDAVNLSWKLAAVAKGSPRELLETYQSERIAFARRLVGTTDKIFTLATKPGTIARVVRTRLMPLVVASAMRLTAVRRLFFRTVSQIALNYRGVAFNAGSAGGVHGGDRLPWVRAGGGDNFEALASLAWQVHVYGEPRPDLKRACADLGLPLATFSWSPEAKAAGLARGAFYLVRPDGYVALASPDPDPERLRGYLRERKLTTAVGSLAIEGKDRGPVDRSGNASDAV